MADADRRVEIGFDGGLILSMRLPTGEWAIFETALQEGQGMVTLRGDESTYHVDVSKVCYVKHETHSARVGF
jgi:hypothetical protein